MKQQDVIEFFDRLAPGWDASLVRNEAVIAKILDKSGLRPGADVLDVACGTGVLFPDYLARQVGSLTAIDISPEMARRAGEKFPEARVLCGDVEKTEFDRKFDVIMIYNAFPHFPEPERLIACLTRHLKPGGRLTVAHGMSREALLRHHSGTAKPVSIDLLPLEELRSIFSRYLQVETAVSDETMYQVTGLLF